LYKLLLHRNDAFRGKPAASPALQPDRQMFHYVGLRKEHGLTFILDYTMTKAKGSSFSVAR